MSSDIQRLSQQLGDALLAKSWKVATAESCAGGGIAAAITAIAGSSNWFEYGIVSYANQAKINLLNVKPITLDEFGAVSQAVVEQMVAGVLALSHADIAVSVSGIAGPAGGTAQKPVGTVWFAWATKAGQVNSEVFHFAGDRTAIQQAAIAQGLRGLLVMVKDA